MEPSEILALLAGGGGVSGIAVAIGRHLSARRRATRDERVGALRHDETVSPSLLQRIKALEERLDERDDEIRDLHAQAADCERGRVECDAKAETLKRQIDSIQQQQGEIQRTMRDTPARGWLPDGWGNEEHPSERDENEQ